MGIGYKKANERFYGKLKKNSTDKVLQKNEHKLKENGLSYIAYPIASSPVDRYRSLILITTPLPVDDSLSRTIAFKVSNDYGVNFTKYDFGRGEDEVEERDIFYLECFEEEEIEPSIEKLKQARQKVNESLKKIVEIATG